MIGKKSSHQKISQILKNLIDIKKNILNFLVAVKKIHQFFSIAIIVINQITVSIVFIAEEMKYSLIESSKFLALADKTIINVSLDSILAHFEYLFKDFKETALEMLGIFIDLLIDDSYTADEEILLRTVFSLQNLYSSNEKIRILFDKYGFNLIERILKIDDFSQLNDVKKV